jgi:serine/threonine protein kinase
MMIGKSLGNLRIVSELGRGGMGVVYLAEHKTLNKKFAVKSLSPQLTEDAQFRERFYQEARNQALLDHPNIVQATDFFEENRQFFFCHGIRRRTGSG